MNEYDARRVRRGRRRRKKRPAVFTRKMRLRLLLAFFLFVISFAVMLIVIYRIDTNDGDRYRKTALAQQAYTNTVLNYQRGSIKDRNNTTMAVSVRKFDLVLEPRTLLADDTARITTVNAICEFFSVDRDTIEKAINENESSMYEHIEELRRIESDRVDEFKKKMEEEDEIKGVWFEETYTREYPLGSVACSVVGFLSSESNGAYGVEKSYNEELSGTTGREYGYFDSNMDLQRTVKEAKDGNSVVLTLDANVQQLVEKQIENFQKNGVGAENVAVMIMNPNNGEILAMASDSTFDLNEPQDLTGMYTQKQISSMTAKKKKNALLEMWSNFCVGSDYEPGSTYKPFTIAAALDENLIRDSDVFTCHGVKKVADWNIHCANRSGHGTLDLRHSLMESCNVALMEIGEKLGRGRFYRYNKLYGFGQKTGIDLPDETSGIVYTKEGLNAVELATSSFGQRQTVTMVQMLSGFCSLVNGGDYYQPHIVKEIVNSKGEVVESMDPVVVKKTTTEDTSTLLKSYLKSTVEKGTASPAQVKGYSIGGKTGTAEKRGNAKKKYLVSFIGCVPAEDPELAIYVIVDEPHVKDQAHSTYATEFASKIMKKVLPFLGQYAEE